MGIRKLPDAQAIAPLFEGWGKNLVRSTLDGCMGEAYANDTLTAAQIVNGDFAFLAGDAACGDALLLATHMPEDFSGDTLLLSPMTGAWESVIERGFGPRAVRSERYAVRGDTRWFDRAKLLAFTQTLPENVTLCPMNGALYQKALEARWSRDFVCRFRDENDFLARGLGVMALLEGEPLSGASSYGVFHGGIEIEVDTRADWRRRGLATACSAALMLACLERGLYPGWDADNRASVALAEKLGYRMDRPYVTYRVEPTH